MLHQPEASLRQQHKLQDFTEGLAHTFQMMISHNFQQYVKANHLRGIVLWQGLKKHFKILKSKVVFTIQPPQQILKNKHQLGNKLLANLWLNNVRSMMRI